MNEDIQTKRKKQGGIEAAGWAIPGVLLAVGVIYHAVDMDLFAHVHGEDKCKPACAQVGAWLNPANKKKNNASRLADISPSSNYNHLQLQTFINAFPVTYAPIIHTLQLSSLIIVTNASTVGSASCDPQLKCKFKCQGTV